MINENYNVGNSDKIIYYFILDGSFIDLAYLELRNILESISNLGVVTFSSLEISKNSKSFFLESFHEIEIEKFVLIKNFVSFVKEIGKLIYKTTFNFNLSFNENMDNIIPHIEQINWNKVLPASESFKIRLQTIGNFAKNSKFGKDQYYNSLHLFGGAILKHSTIKVDLNNPFYLIDFICWDSGNLIFGINLFRINRGIIEKRAPKNRIFFHPASMNPFLIRCMLNFGLTTDLVNHLNSKEHSYFLDPFMGGGGMVIDALDIGYYAIGIDLEYWMGRGTRMNIIDFEEKIFFTKMPWNLISSSSQNIPLKDNTVDLIVTDPPYGVSTSLKGLDFNNLLNLVLKDCFRVLKKNRRIVISIPSNYSLPDFVNKSQIIFSVSTFVHRSLTRNIWVLENH